MPIKAKKHNSAFSDRELLLSPSSSGRATSAETFKEKWINTEEVSTIHQFSLDVRIPDHCSGWRRSSWCPYHCVTPLVTSMSAKSICTCGPEQRDSRSSETDRGAGWITAQAAILPCRCPSSLGCRTSCYSSRTHPTFLFGLPGVKHQIQTCKKRRWF